VPGFFPPDILMQPSVLLVSILGSEGKSRFFRVNTELSETDSLIEDPQPNEEKPKPKRPGRGLAFLALLISFAAIAGTAWMWWQGQAQKSDDQDRVYTEISRLDGSDSELSLKLKQLNDRIDTLPSSDNSSALSSVERRLESGVSDVEQLEKALNEQLSLTRSLQAAAESMQGRLLAAEAAVSGVASRELDAGGELDLAEVDYLLRLANERLKLFSDPEAADEVLKLADIHLEALNNPVYLGVRQEIASARRELAAVELPDYFAISNELDDIQSSLESLPFRNEVPKRAEPKVVAIEEGWWAKLKGVFSGLVTVRRSTGEEDERISLQDRDYVRQRLWLQLEIAQLSLMRHDHAEFRHSLDRVQQSLSTWFDNDAADFQSIQTRLTALQSTEIRVSAPDINQPWATLKLIREGSARPLHEAPPPESSTAPETSEAQVDAGPTPANESTETESASATADSEGSTSGEEQE